MAIANLLRTLMVLVVLATALGLLAVLGAPRVGKRLLAQQSRYAHQTVQKGAPMHSQTAHTSRKGHPRHRAQTTGSGRTARGPARLARGFTAKSATRRASSTASTPRSGVHFEWQGS